MSASIKKSRTTDKTIIVLNGRIKVGEVVGKDIRLTGGHSGADLHYIEKLAAKEGLKIKYTHGGHQRKNRPASWRIGCPLQSLNRWTSGSGN